MAVVFEIFSGVSHAKTHFGGLRQHADFVHEFNEIWVSPIVEYDKSGINGELPFGHINVNGMSMTANIIVRFEQGNVVIFMQQMGAG